jgi:hypothetical protein
MRSRDHEICIEISQLLSSMEIEEENPEKLLMKYELNEAENKASVSFNYIYKDKKYNLAVDPDSLTRISELVLDLRDFFIENKQPPWKGCYLEIDKVTGEMEIDYFYE